MINLFKKRIYLDYASLTPIDPRVTRLMKKYSSFAYANPSSLYKEGVAAKKALAEGRQKVANYLNSHTDEIIFTAGGTEANNLAIEGVVRAFINKKTSINIQVPHIIISSIEHSSVIEVANKLEKIGCEGIKCEVTRLAVDKDGIISLDELKKSIKGNTILVSIMMVNNEIGSVQPIKEIAKIIRNARKSPAGPTSYRSDLYPLLHTDAAQALYRDINMDNLGVDMLTLDGGKVYGPRGIGALYVEMSVLSNKLIEPIVLGGGQEFGLRSGTENLPAIMGFSMALELAKKERVSSQLKMIEFRSIFIEGLIKIRPDIIVNGNLNSGTPQKSSENKGENVPQSPHILNISIPGIDNEFFLFQLDARGIACSTKSSCLRDEEESYVLKSIGADSKASLRFSFGRFTKKGDIKKALLAFQDIF